MIDIRPLAPITREQFLAIASGYSTASRYAVKHLDTDARASIALELVPLDEPITKRWTHPDDETLARYNRILGEGHSFGAYRGEDLLGFLIAEPEPWNRSLWVWEFHVAKAEQGRGMGRRLMDRAAETARQAGLRIVVCESQSTNVAAIRIYRKLGFQVHGLDISYYTNDDDPEEGIAVFMKRRLDETPSGGVRPLGPIGRDLGA